MKKISNHVRIVVATAILCLCFTTLFVALLNIKKVALPPDVYIERFWEYNFPVDSLSLPDIQRGDVNISVVNSYFENAFIRYEKMLVWADDPAVKEAQVYNITIEDIPTLLFRVETETVEKETYVIFEFVLAQPMNITGSSQLIVIAEATGHADTARMELSGTDEDGNWKASGLIDFYQDGKFFAYILPLHESKFITLNKILVVYYCVSGGSIHMTTKIRALNILDGIPSIDGAPLTWGTNYIYLTDITFPHKFEWDLLKPLKIFLVSTLHKLTATWHSSFNLMNYSWLVQNPETVQKKKANALIWLDRSNDALIISARITAPEKGTMEEIDFLEDIQRAFSASTSRYVRCVEPIPTECEEVRISIILDFWPSPWREMALISCGISIIELVVLTYKRITRFFKR